MSQESTILLEKHQAFIKTVCKNEAVWGLENSEGFATSSSEEYEDENGELIGLICFWSEEKLAAACIQDDWSDYKPTKIPLNEFFENWCLGMSNDGLMAGTDFDNEMFGHEVDTLELILELGKELKAQGKTIKLEGFETLDLLLEEVQMVINSEG